MTLYVFLSLLSACTGFAAAMFFALGTVKLSDKTIFELAGTYFDFNEATAKGLSKQKADYLSGALLISLSFGLQFFTAILPSTAAQATVSSSVYVGIFYVLLATAFLLAAVISVKVILVRQSFSYIAEQKKKAQDAS